MNIEQQIILQSVVNIELVVGQWTFSILAADQNLGLLIDKKLVMLQLILGSTELVIRYLVDRLID